MYVPPSLHITSLTLRTVLHLGLHSASCQWKLPCDVVVHPTRGRCKCLEVSSWCYFHLCFPHCHFHDFYRRFYSNLRYAPHTHSAPLQAPLPLLRSSPHSLHL